MQEYKESQISQMGEAAGLSVAQIKQLIIMYKDKDKMPLDVTIRAGNFLSSNEFHTRNMLYDTSEVKQFIREIIEHCKSKIKI